MFKSKKKFNLNSWIIQTEEEFLSSRNQENDFLKQMKNR